jgi:hypothetical protein
MRQNKPHGSLHRFPVWAGVWRVAGVEQRLGSHGGVSNVIAG